MYIRDNDVLEYQKSEHSSKDDLMKALAQVLFCSLDELQNGDEFQKLLGAEDAELQEEAAMLYNEINSLKYRLERLTE